MARGTGKKAITGRGKKQSASVENRRALASGKGAARLDLSESALLAGLIRSPD